MKRLVAALALACVLPGLAAAPALAAPAVNGVFPLKSLDGSNAKLVAGPDGNIWVAVNSGGNDVARVTPAGEVTEFELNGISEASGIAVGPEGKLWVTGSSAVASFSPTDPKGSASPTMLAAIVGPSPIVAGPDGQMWVATLNTVLHFDPADPAGAVPIAVAGLQPKDIDAAGPLLAVADGNGGAPRIATFTTAGVEKDYTVGNAAQGVAGGPGDQLAYSAPDAKEAGLITPPGPAKVTEVEGDPFGVAFGADGAYWYARSAKDDVARLTTDGQVSYLGGFPEKYFPRQIAGGPGNTLWVTMEIPGENIYAVARISGLEPSEEGGGAPSAAPRTKIVKGPKKRVRTTRKRAKVKFRFRANVGGARFQCALVKLRKGKRSKAVFKSCKSPRTYKLKPGRYRFKVRAIADGRVDRTPATRAFRVIRVGKHKAKR